MLFISQAERHFVLSLIFLGLVCTGFSYYKKTVYVIKVSPAEINEPHLLVNINTADVAQFERLPGIGPVLARRIIAYREARGHFESTQELRNVKGISDTKFEDMKDFVTLSD
jgi:competence ComEA-like helix-hairpin-helix protein